jgi:hypothetical protein
MPIFVKVRNVAHLNRLINYTMYKFIEYRHLPDLEILKSHTLLLEANGIPFEVDDSAMRYNITPVTGTGNPWDNQYILKIREEDVDKVDKLLAEGNA